MTSTSRPCSFRRSSEKLARTCNSQRKLASNETGTSESKGIMLFPPALKLEAAQPHALTTQLPHESVRCSHTFSARSIGGKEGGGARERSESESEKVSVMKSLRLKSRPPDEEQGSLWKDSASLKPRWRPTVEYCPEVCKRLKYQNLAASFCDLLSSPSVYVALLLRPCNLPIM